MAPDRAELTGAGTIARARAGIRQVGVVMESVYIKRLLLISRGTYFAALHVRRTTTRIFVLKTCQACYIAVPKDISANQKNQEASICFFYEIEKLCSFDEQVVKTGEICLGV